MNQNLQHMGVLGMKWGKHLATAKTGVDSTGRIIGDLKKTNESVNLVKKNKAIKKIPSPAEITDADLKKMVTRMNLEQQYTTLSTSRLSAGKTAVDDILSVAGTAIAVTSSALALAMTIKQMKG